MCKPFSGIITRSGKGYYDNKIQSHSEVVDLFKSQDPELADDKLPPDNTFAKFEITPDNGNLLLPDNWSFNLDEDVKPKWWKKRHEEKAWEIHKDWLEWLHNKIDVSKYPKNPLLMKPQPFEIGDSIGDSIRCSIRYSIWDSIGDSIGDSIRCSIRYSIWDSIRCSIRCSIWINTAFMIPEVWEKYKEYQPIVDLWHKGIVPVWYQDAWHYFGSPEGDCKCVELKGENKSV